MRPENGGFILNRCKIQSVIASSQKTGYEIEKAFTKFATELFICPNNTLTVKMTLTTPGNVTGLALINHNLTSSASILLSYFSDPGFSTPIVEKNIPPEKQNTFLIYNEAPTTQYLQLYAHDTTLNEIQIGCIYPGQNYQFPHNFSWGYTEEFCVDKEVDTTDAGVNFEYPDEDEPFPAAEFSRLKISFNDVNKEHYRQFRQLIRPGKKIFIPNFTKTDCCFYGIVPNKNLSTSRNKPGDNFSIDFWEDSLTGGQ